jgi:hypothetical protein
MASLTPNFKFKIPSLSDPPNIIAAVSGNVEAMDAALAHADCGDWDTQGGGCAEPDGCDCAE